MLELNIPTLKYLSYRHGKIAYVDTGEGPTLFLLHGMNGNSKSWANLFHSLNSSYRVIAWDAPSFGKSDVFGDTIEDYKIIKEQEKEKRKIEKAEKLEKERIDRAKKIKEEEELSLIHI